ncbi:MAG: NAD-dependent epimerase/dehydratase family protein [Acidobacteriota bacterium]|nr:NAD-dependent epimerase/dehydratase family protein [Blastocatellia bacterium]MDW8412185.1 NAD-dependent epimerase/dehydratase family protein [Acidobacteriota bacterium]
MHVAVTGGSGFIGSRLVNLLAKRGYEVSCLIHNNHAQAEVHRVVNGDLLDTKALSELMEGVDGLFHLAAIFEIGTRRAKQMHLVNVEGTRRVLTIAQEKAVQKIVYCSSVVALGATKDSVADERWNHDGVFQSEYCRSKYLAHMLAKEFQQAGLPLIICMPSAVYGSGNPSALGRSWELYTSGKLPFVIAPSTRLTYVHVDDVAEGLLLAFERGRLGESYILAGEIRTNLEVLDLIDEVTGKKRKKWVLPLPLAKLAAIVDELVSSLQGQAPLLSLEAIEMLSCNWAVSSEKARAELGWTTRTLQQGLKQMFTI